MMNERPLWVYACLLTAMIGGSAWAQPEAPPSWADPQPQRSALELDVAAQQRVERPRRPVRIERYKIVRDQDKRQTRPSLTPTGNTPRYLPELPGSGHDHLGEYIRSRFE